MKLVEAPRRLEPIEEDYVRHVAWHMRDIDPRRRRQLIDEVRSHLADRPVPTDEEQLWDELGPPAQYVTELRGVHGLLPERTDWWARWLAIPYRRRWARALATIVVVALVATGAIATRWWVNWQVDIDPVSEGIAWSDANGLADHGDFSGIEHIERFDSRIISIDVTDRQDVVLTIGLLMSRTPRRVTIPLLEVKGTDWPPVALLSSTIAPQLGTTPTGTTTVPGLYKVEFHLRAACPLLGTASTLDAYSFGELRVEYHTFGRRRERDVPLGETVQFEFPDSACR